MDEKKFSKSAIKAMILQKFATLRECADALGITEQELQGRMRRSSNKFLHQLLRIGVLIPSYNTSNHQNISNNSNDDMNLNLGTGNVVKVMEQKQQYSNGQIAVLEYRVKILEDELKEVKKILYSKK